MRHNPIRACVTLLLFPGLAASALACGDAGVVEVVQDGGETDPLEPGIEVHATLTPLTAQALAPLGWSGGVPGVTLKYSRIDNGVYLWTTVTTDAQGRFFVGELEPGDYWFSGERVLSASEAAGLPASQETAGVLGGAPSRIRVQADIRTLVEIPLSLDDPGTLVISEVQMNIPEPWDVGGTYLGGGYLELHNSSESVVYLDGMLLGMAYDWILEADHHPCATTQGIRTDSTTLWADVLWRFPGAGGEYSVGPGETVLIAASATDHRDVHSSLTDLRDADFELQNLFSGGADNPGVPNLDEVGPTLLMRFGFSRHKVFWYLATPLGDLGALPSMVDPGGSDRTYVGMPADRILDVAMIVTDNSGNALSLWYGKCDRGVAARFDRVPGGYFTAAEKTMTSQRRVVTTLEGRRVLLDTNTSGVDFVLLPQSPGWIPGG